MHVIRARNEYRRLVRRGKVIDDIRARAEEHPDEVEGPGPLRPAGLTRLGDTVRGVGDIPPVGQTGDIGGQNLEVRASQEEQLVRVDDVLAAGEGRETRELDDGVRAIEVGHLHGVVAVEGD